jgi:hypothetical protein
MPTAQMSFAEAAEIEYNMILSFITWLMLRSGVALCDHRIPSQCKINGSPADPELR